ncbi:MAG: uracil phosphoribosyltransferase [Verrucomicrobiota bacterium]
MSSLHIIDHPIIRQRLTVVRSAESDTTAFRMAMHDIARLMVFEVTKDFETKTTSVETPLTETDGAALARPIVLVPILRAGVGLMQGFSEILPEAAIGYVGLYRDEDTLEPQTYYCNMPPQLDVAEVIVIDPMLATGNSAADAIDKVKAEGAKQIRFVCLIAAPEGVESLQQKHPEIPIYCASLDECLNEKAYIVPGLGDAGDRYFGT